MACTNQLIITTLIQAVKLPTTITTRLSSPFDENELKKQPSEVFCEKFCKACNFIKKETLAQVFFSVNFSRFFRTSFLQNTSGRLLLQLQGDSEKKALVKGFSQNCKLKVGRCMEIRVFVYQRTSNTLQNFGLRS